MTTGLTSVTDDTLTREWRDWHAERERALREPHGWLSPVALYWPETIPTAYPDLPGRWRATGDGGVELTASAEDGLELDGRAVVGTVRLDPVDGAPGPRVVAGRRQVEVLRRTDAVALRVRDPEAITRTAFTGVPSWPVAAGWVRPGRFTAYPQPRRITVDAVVDGLHHYPTAVGEVEFELAGVPRRLVALAGPDGALSLHFRDATSGAGSYGGGRILRLPPPGPDGAVTVDLNRTVNLPCAFIAHATCPLPPEGNALPVAVEAGERTPDRPDLAG